MTSFLDEPPAAAREFDEQAIADLHDDLLIERILQLPEDSRHLHNCWGGLLAGNTSMCSPGFKIGVNHFKGKLCAACLAHGVLVPAERICALDPSAHSEIANKNSGGLWTAMATDSGTEFRVLNQTAKCTGPRLVCFKATAPDGPWAAMPPGWVVDGCLLLDCRKGTMVPAAVMQQRADPSTACALTAAVAVGTGTAHELGPSWTIASSQAAVAGAVEAGAGGSSASSRSDSSGPTPVATESGSDRGSGDHRHTSTSLGALLSAHDTLSQLIERQLSVSGGDGLVNAAGDAVTLSDDHLRLLRRVLPPLRASADALGRLASPLLAEEEEEESVVSSLADADEGSESAESAKRPRVVGAPPSDAAVSIPPSAPGSTVPGSTAAGSTANLSSEASLPPPTMPILGMLRSSGLEEQEDNDDEDEEARLARLFQLTGLSDPRSLDDCHAAHSVGVGETLATIALRHGLSEAELRAWNRLLLSPSLRVGQELRLEPPPRDGRGLQASHMASHDPVRLHQAPVPLSRPGAASRTLLARLSEDPA